MEVYVLWTQRNPVNPIIAVADDPERLNMLMADFPAIEQASMHIWNGDMLQRGDND